MEVEGTRLSDATENELWSRLDGTHQCDAAGTRRNPFGRRPVVASRSEASCRGEGQREPYQRASRQGTTTTPGGSNVEFPLASTNSALVYPRAVTPP